METMEATENRQSARHRTLKRARIVFNDGSSSFECIVRDISDTGAKVRTNGWFSCPDEVGLQIPESIDDHGIPRDCRIVWRQGDTMGVAFDAA